MVSTDLVLARQDIASGLALNGADGDWFPDTRRKGAQHTGAAATRSRKRRLHKSESASRPVSRVLYGLRPKTKTWQPFLWDTHCCAPQATYPDDQPRKKGRACALRHPYSVLLPVGFTVPLPLPVARWALTPPFHPYPARQMTGRTGDKKARRFAFCGTFPGVAPAGRYPAPFIRGARTFLALLSFDVARRGCPADWRALLRPRSQR